MPSMSSSHANPAQTTPPPKRHPSLETRLHGAPYNDEDDNTHDGMNGTPEEGRNASSLVATTRRQRAHTHPPTVSPTRPTAGFDHSRMTVNPGHNPIPVQDLFDPAPVSSRLAAPSSSFETSPGRRDRSRPTADSAPVWHGESDREQHQPSPRVGTAVVMDYNLPENDGMHALRHRLLEIQELAISTEDKARRMHDLMTREYLVHIATSNPTLVSEMSTLRVPSPHLDNGVQELPVHAANPYNLHPADLIPTLCPAHHPDEHNGHKSSDAERPALGCAHYKRNVKIQCFDCHRWFPCRHCHDAAPDLPFEHSLNRRKTRNMLCMLCKTPQPAGETCVSCGEYAAWYYCAKCKLWDNDSNKRIYHCDECGLCRLGEGLGKDFVHCRRCNVCISISTSASHPCVERATDSDCPLCLSYLFESPTPVVSLPCGHYMHGACYHDLMAVTYKCPVCNKSAVNMEIQWRKLDDAIAAQPMPEDDDDVRNILPLAQDLTGEAQAEGPTPADPASSPRPRRPRTVWIGCNDCGAHCWTPFHWLGLKCDVCGGYNTNQTAPLAGRETETERLLRQQAQPRLHDFTGNAVLLDAGIGITSDDSDLHAESGLAIPASPSSNLSADGRAGGGGGAHSPSRRYFVQDEQSRRASSTAPRFPAPTMPNLPNLPRIPDLSRMPDLPRMPDMPPLPSLPRMPDMPNMPNLELPRFSPYEMVAAISRSLSPMRSYMEGFDVRDDLLGRAPWSRGKGDSRAPVDLAATGSRGRGGARKRSHVGGAADDAAVESSDEAESDGEVESEYDDDDDDYDDDDEDLEAVGRGAAPDDSDTDDEDDFAELIGHR